MSNTPPDGSLLQQFFRALGPAIIVACVVLGPGSILTSSKVGCQFGYSMQWVLVAAAVLMFGAVATSARIGAMYAETPCEALARRLGRPLAVVTGASVFLMAACFQYSNNLGVLAGIEPFVELSATARGGLLVGLNATLIACLYGFKRLYVPIERLMMLLMGLMVLGFAANLLRAQPSLLAVMAGWVPSLPAELTGSWLPRLETPPGDQRPILVDPWLAVQGLTVTTFSIAGAFYHAYLVREKGLKPAQLQAGLVDSLAGTFLLMAITLMIMVTSATVLAGQVDPEELNTAADVARQLEPLFGPAAKVLFCVGILAGATSSFLVNSMVGGTLLADGLGLPARIDSPYTKAFTVACLMTGMVVALGTSDTSRVPLIVFAQAMTVLGGPVLAFTLLYLATRRAGDGRRVAPRWMLALASLGGAAVVLLALRTALRLWLQLTG